MAKKKNKSSGAAIGDLFAPPQPAPDASPAGQASAAQSFGGLSLLVIALVGILLLVSWSKFAPAPDDGGGDRRQDQHGERHDQAAAKDGYLIFIHERQDMDPAEADTLDMARQYCAAHPGLEMRSVDKEDPLDDIVRLKAFAKGKGISPPCVVFKTKDNTPRSAAKWPTSEADLQKVVSGK